VTKDEANEKPRDDLKHVIRDAEDLLKATADHAGEKGDEVRSPLTAALVQVSCGQPQDKRLEAASATGRAIPGHTHECLGIASRVGALA
jgi:ElaB/YqjD/DUF883 family membrane-anchored ribosome-binding protein